MRKSKREQVTIEILKRANRAVQRLNESLQKYMPEERPEFSQDELDEARDHRIRNAMREIRSKTGYDDQTIMMIVEATRTTWGFDADTPIVLNHLKQMIKKGRPIGDILDDDQ